MLPAYVVPGQPVTSTPDAYEMGVGLELQDGKIVATLLGQVRATTTAAKRTRLDVVNKFANPYNTPPPASGKNSQRATSSLPDVGDIVFAQVQRLNPNQVNLQILAVENKGELLPDSGVGWSAHAVGTVRQATGSLGDLAELGESYGGIIRQQDIRATEREKINISECFRPGDIVRAKVRSIGDGSNYFLSTVENNLGVVFARSTYGANLLPLDWQSMTAPTTSEIEPRKVANPFV